MVEKVVKWISDEERGKTRLDDRYRCQPHPDFNDRYQCQPHPDFNDRYRCQPHPDFSDKEENNKQRSYTDANTSLNIDGQGSWLIMEVVRVRGSLWKWSGLVARYGSVQGSWLVMEVVRARGS